MDSFLGVYTMGGGFGAEKPRRAALRGEKSGLVDAAAERFSELSEF